MSQEPTKQPNPKHWANDYGPALFRYALARVSDRGVAEELVQETFLAALKSFDQFEGQSTVQTWLIGILRHKLLDHFRSQFKRQAVEIPMEEDDPERDLFDARGRWKHPPAQWGSDPHVALQSREFRQVLNDCLGRISPEKRAVLLLRTAEGLSSDEICRQLAITPANMWVLMHRARAALRRCLENRWFREKESR